MNIFLCFTNYFIHGLVCSLVIYAFHAGKILYTYNSTGILKQIIDLQNK
jgi:hypothetical protein